MRDLNYDLKQLCRRSRGGSFATQRDRERVLDLVANQLQELGYRYMTAASLKPRHVERLVERWQAEGLSLGTIKNRMAELRWWAERIGKQNIIARDNAFYGIADRQYVTNVSKARQLTGAELGRITDLYTAMSLRLQAAFGLRRAESIKIQPEWADRGKQIVLKDSWTKGGRSREIPIRNDEQRRVLDEAKALAGKGSLIPADQGFVEQLRRFEQPQPSWPRSTAGRSAVPTNYKTSIELPSTGYVRLPQVIALVPFSKSTLWRQVKTGAFPKPVKLSARITAWRVEDVRRWIGTHGPAIDAA